MLFGWKHLTPAELGAIERGILTGKVQGGPFHLELHPTNRCNAQCFFCFTEHYRFGQSLAFEKIKTVLEDGARLGVRFIRLSGGGEPLIHPQTSEIIELCAGLGMRFVDITTNGITLGRHAQRIVDIGADYIFVSLNEPNAALYEQTMQIKGKNFDKVLDSVRTLVAVRDAAPPEARPEIALQFMIGGHNFQHMTEMVELGTELGVDHIDIKGMKLVTQDRHIPDAALPEVREQIAQIARLDGAAGRRVRFDLATESDLNLFAKAEQAKYLPPADLDGAGAQARATQRTEYCVIGWFSATVTATGMVYPCCPLHESPGKALGDLNKQSLPEIWNGERYAKLRETLRQVMLLRGDMKYSPKCHGCIDKMCIGQSGCYFTYNLASPEFYAGLAARLEEQVPLWERIVARGQNTAISSVHAARQLLRTAAPR